MVLDNGLVLHLVPDATASSIGLCEAEHLARDVARSVIREALLTLPDEPCVLREAASVKKEWLGVSIAQCTDPAQIGHRYRLAADRVVRDGDHDERHPIPFGLERCRERPQVGGAETPEEVATSILAELLAIRRGFDGGFLSGSIGSLHRPEDQRLLASS
jgi:hypothetical protein